LRLFDIGLPTGILAAEYLVHYGMPKSALFAFPYNSDNNYLAMVSEEAGKQKESFRKKMGMPSDAFVILGVLKLIPREDPLTLLRAFFLIQNDLPSTHLLIIGDGNLRTKIEEEIQTQCIRNVHLLGYMPYSQLPLYYAMADVFAHPAQVEPWGVSVMEAMACGLPVVASSGVGVAQDLIVPGETGFIFRTGEAVELSDYLKQIGKNPDLRKAMSSNAKNIINHRWHYRSMAENLWEAVRYIRFQQQRR
jgi:glycosyltransferase involved in cell wall biosynthesis